MSLEQALREQERAWCERPLLRRLYRSWFALVAENLAAVPGPTVELGAGIGRLRELVPDVVQTDVEPTPWVDTVVDAEALPYADGAVANLILVDVFHHLARPARFLSEANRALAVGGRIVILDPYCSFVSTPLYRRFHHELTDLSVPAFDDVDALADDPMTSNQARATLVFFRGQREFEERWPHFRVVERRRLANVLYPLSGGFTRRPLVPAMLHRPLAMLDRALDPFGAALAWRCLIVLECTPQVEPSSTTPHRPSR